MYKFARFLFGLYVRILNRYKVTGLENIVQSGPTIVYGNHSSMFDIFLLTVAFKRPIYFMAKKSLFETPVINLFVKAYKAFPVNRDKFDISAVKTALKLLKEGNQIGIFPEGTRVHDESQSDAKGGIAMFACKTKATLIPVRLIYKRKLNVFNCYHVIIGKPIHADELEVDGKDYKKAGEWLMERVYEL